VWIALQKAMRPGRTDVRLLTYGFLAILWAATSGCVLKIDAPDPGENNVADLDPDASVGDASLPTCGEQPTATRLPAYVVSDPVLADGVLTEPAWQHAARVTFSNAARSDNQTTVAALWSATHLYFAFSFVDGEIETAGDIGSLHADDGAEVYLDVLHDRTLAENDDDQHFITTTDDLFVGGDLEIGTEVAPPGFTQEIGITWAQLAASPVPDQVLGLLLGNNDRTAGSFVQYDWIGLIESGNYDRPNLWGELALSGHVAGPCTEP
jgi:hypothetical protein